MTMASLVHHHGKNHRYLYTRTEASNIPPIFPSLVMTTATNIYYGTRIGYIAELSDGTYFTDLPPDVLELCDFNLQEFFEDIVIEEFMLIEQPTPAALRKMA